MYLEVLLMKNLNFREQIDKEREKNNELQKTIAKQKEVIVRLTDEVNTYKYDDKKQATKQQREFIDSFFDLER